MLNFYVRHGKIFDKLHEINSFKQSKWLEEYIIFNTQKRKSAINALEYDFYKLLKNSFFGTTMGYLWKRLKRDFSKK